MDRGFNMQAINDFISSVGFPIVVAIAMFYQNNIMSSNYQKLTQQLQDKIENNTVVLSKVLDHLNANDSTEKSDTKWYS